MNETTNGENSTIVSMMDSSKGSVSTSGRSNTSSNAQELIEQLKRKLRDAESENLELKRALPYLKDSIGDDCTEWAIKITNELEEQRTKYRTSQDRLAQLATEYRNYRENAESRARHAEQAIHDFKEKAMKLEEENQKLRDRIRDEESANYHLQFDGLNGDGDERGEQMMPASGGGDRSSAENQQEFEEALRHIERRSETDDPQSGRSTAKSGRPDSARYSALEGIAYSLFDKLRSTADFFLQLLNSISQDAEHQQENELLQKIKSLRLDLNRSIEMYNKRMQELRQSALSSLENTFNQEDLPARPCSSHQAADQTQAPPEECFKCKLVEHERDTLRAQLNREICIKEEYLEQREESERNLREMRRRMEEVKSELQRNQQRVEDIEQKLRRKEEYYQSKFGGRQSAEMAELHDKIRQLRQKNLELDAKNEEVLRAAHRYKELNQEEINNKDIELQRLLAINESWEGRYAELEQHCKQMEQRARSSGDEREAALQRELIERNTLLRKYAKKMEKLRAILASYGHYFEKSMDFEALVEQSTDQLAMKIVDGQQQQRGGTGQSNSNNVYRPN